MTPTSSVIADVPGPRAQRRARIVSAVTIALLLVLLAVVLMRLNQRGQFDRKYWRDLQTGEAVRFLLTGLLNTLKVAAVATVLSLAFGLVLAVGRLARHAVVRFVAGAYVEALRCFPLVVLILVLNRMFSGPQVGFWVMVVALTLYNSAVLCEVFKAGVRSLPAGQREAGLAVGLRSGQVMRGVLMPQAIRLMLPTIMNQVVTIVMDTSLGRFVSYGELLTRGYNFGVATQFGDFLKDQNQLQALFVTGVIYVGLCLALSQVTRYLERRQRRRPTAGVDADAVPVGVENLGLQALQTG